MRYIKSLLILLLVAALSSCSKSPVTVFVNGKIYSLDGNNTVYEAMAIRDGKILEIGTTAKIKEKFDTKDVIDLNGKTVIPGFTDMEGSLVEFAKNLNFINFSNVKSIEEVQKLISDNAKLRKEGSWVVGYALNELNFKEEDLLKFDKSLLDVSAPNHNVYIVNITGDMVWANSKLLQTLQITNQTPDPKDGEIEKNEKGELTGLLFDKAVNLVKEKSPEISKEDLASSLQLATLELAKYGITEVHDRTVNKEAINLFKQIIDSNKLAIKMYGILSAGDASFEEYLTKGIEVNYKDYLTVRAVSIDYDGALTLQAASMNDKYKTDIKNTFLYATDEEIETTFKKAIDKGFQFCIKSVGDKAVTNNLNIIEKVLKEKNPKDHRTVLEYIEFISPSDLSRLGALKIIPSVRPEETMTDIGIIKDYISENNLNSVGMWNAMLQSTKYITAGTNFPYSNYISPITLIHLLVNRQPFETTQGSIPNPNQKLSVLDAVKAFTVYAAYAGFQENTKGTLEKDKYADFIVLSDDIFIIDAGKINNIKVLKTVVNGKIVFGK